MMKNRAKLAQLLKFILIMPVSERVRSSWGPSRLTHHGDIRPSQWSKPKKFHEFGWTTKSLLWCPFRCVEWRARSVTEAEFYGSVRGVILSFIHKTLALNSLFSNCHVKKKLRCLYEPQFGRISLNISLSDLTNKDLDLDFRFNKARRKRPEHERSVGGNTRRSLAAS